MGNAKPVLFILGFMLILTGEGVNCDHSADGVKIMCDSPQKELSCLVDPYFQFKCKEECKSLKHLEREVGGYPELFSLPALAVMNSKVSKDAKGGESGECVDLAPYCQLMAANIGGFYRCSLSALTRYQCPKSCGACPSKTATLPLKAPSVGVEQAKTAPLGACRDLLPICKGLYAPYACLNDFTFKRKCPVTCGLCTPDTKTKLESWPSDDEEPIDPSECVDRIPVCDSVYSHFACNEQEFKKQCPISCGLCKPKEDDTKLESDSPGVRAATPAGTCSDKLPMCGSKAAKYACLHDPHFVTECPLSCGLCKPSDDAPKAGVPFPFIPAAKCSDKLPMCLTVYAQFACVNDPHFVSQCPVTCGMCQPDDDTPTDVIEGCKDVSNAFCQWVTDSMCGFMDIRLQCPAKCGLCASETSESRLEVVRETEFLGSPSDYDYDDDETNTTTAEPVTSTTEEPDDCVDILPAFICKAFWAKFSCADNTTDFRYKCKKSCGFCPSKMTTTTTESSATCKDDFPKFVCEAYWAKFACSNTHSGFARKCKRSCGHCPDDPEGDLDLLESEPVELEYEEKADSVKKLETLLAHYYLKLEQVPEEVFDYENEQICGSEFMKKFGCVHDAVASVFCKETCLNVIGQLMNSQNPMQRHPPVYSMLQMGVLDESAESVELDGSKIGTSVSTIVGGCLGIVALVSVVLGVTLKIVAHRRSQRLYSKL